jgi:hypothetical protein
MQALQDELSVNSFRGAVLNFPEEVWRTIKQCFMLRDVETMTHFDSDLELLKTCSNMARCSRHVHQLTHTWVKQKRLIMYVVQLRQEINMNVDLSQLRARPWTPQSLVCAVRNCQTATGMFVPWHAGRGIYGPTDGNYRGPLGMPDEESSCSEDGPQEISERLQRRGLCLIVCSTSCWRYVEEQRRYWPLMPSERTWSVLRGAPAITTDELAELSRRARWRRRAS